MGMEGIQEKCIRSCTSGVVGGPLLCQVSDPCRRRPDAVECCFMTSDSAYFIVLPNAMSDSNHCLSEKRRVEDLHPDDMFCD